MTALTVADRVQAQSVAIVLRQSVVTFGGVVQPAVPARAADIIAALLDHIDGEPARIAEAVAAERRECAHLANTYRADGYMSERERSYCHEHGEEIATAILARTQTADSEQSDG